MVHLIVQEYLEILFVSPQKAKNHDEVWSRQIQPEVDSDDPEEVAQTDQLELGWLL